MTDNEKRERLMAIRLAHHALNVERKPKYDHDHELSDLPDSIDDANYVIRRTKQWQTE